MTLPRNFSSTSSIQQKLAQLESATDSRIGISATNTANNQHIQYREHERFPMGCTSKVMGVAAILKESMTNKQLLEEKVFYTEKDLTNWTPVTGKKENLENGMTVEELSAAAISASDNTAMNLLANKLGGPQGLNSFAYSIGDHDFKLDHMWPEEAIASPHGTDDSTTPAAMEKSLQKLVLSNEVISAAERERLLGWMKNTTTGGARIRAGVPQDWTVANKTGTGFHFGTANDIAVVWPPQHAPLVLTLFYSSNKKEALKGEHIVASATRMVMEEFAKTDNRLGL